MLNSAYVTMIVPRRARPSSRNLRRALNERNSGMTRIMLTLALAAAASLAQAQGTHATHPTATPPPTPPPAAAGNKTPPAETVQLPPDQAVISIHGVCDKASGRKGDCTTTITRAQFDRLVAAVNNGRPPLAAAPRRALA